MLQKKEIDQKILHKVNPEFMKGYANADQPKQETVVHVKTEQVRQVQTAEVRKIEQVEQYVPARAKPVKTNERVELKEVSYKVSPRRNTQRDKNIKASATDLNAQFPLRHNRYSIDYKKQKGTKIV